METARHFLKFQKSSLVKRSNGHAVSEALQEGIMEGYITGPYSEGELVELVGKDFSVNPMSCREKPNGKQRRQGWLFSC